ncbi:peptidyl-prolyl cis-trans isomerase [Suttonella ornithocola]|uniref:Periplasmic chaperone PpiD n=1 Tax=Suttonella ornithocola TaxID=279832 RepID=A0A380MY94_9GAMM|nr:peptidyl-prolyl cis-trans isomerase [Suttonella ornithocola]SUO97535.1 Peptidyl-prolyl cis-trans isomerase D [Suttonella ornithocola]
MTERHPSDDIPKKKLNPFVYALVIVAGIGMLFIGVPALTHGNGNRPVATVNGQEIYAHQLSQVANNVKANNPSLPEAQVQEQALALIINQNLLRDQALKDGYEYSDHALYEVIKGQFHDDKAYQQFLNNNRITAANYQYSVRQDETVNSYYQMLETAKIRNPETVQLALQLILQNRDFTTVTLPIAPYVNANPSNADLQTYYDAHQQNYLSPEKVDIRYLLLDAANLTDPNNVTEADIQAEMAKKQANSRRSGQYIIFDHDQDAEAAEKAITDGERDFNAIAEAVKKGEISGQAGDLLLNAKGKGVSKEADEALFALKAEGDVSPVFNTEYGKMIVRVDKIEQVDTISPEQLRREIAAQKSEERYIHLANDLFDAVQSGAGIEQLAETAQTSLQTLENITTVNDSLDWLKNPKVQQTLFGQNAIKVNQVAEPIQLDKHRSLFLVVTQRELPKPEPLDAVRPQVIKAYQISHAKEAQKAVADEIMQAWTKKQSAEALIQKAQAKVETHKEMNALSLESVAPTQVRIFEQALTQTQANTIIELENNDLVLIHLTAITPTNLEAVAPEKLARLRKQYTDLQNASNNALWEAGVVEWLRGKAKITIDQAQLASE